MALPIPQIHIRDNIKDLLEGIKPSANYNTQIEKVFVGNILPTDMFSHPDRAALIQMKMTSQGFGGEMGTAEGRMNTIKQHGTLTIVLVASMKNKTEEEFWLFIMDIYAVFASCPKLNVTSNYYKVHDVIIDSIVVDDIETEFDELEDPLSGNIFEQLAEFIVNVEFIFIPEKMSGAAS